MIKIDPFVFCMNSYPGTDFEAALKFAKRCGFRQVELAAIDGICEQINANFYSPAYVENIRQLLQIYGLIPYALSAHCDMTDDHAFPRLLNKIRIAGDVGCKCVNTRCGPKSNYDIFVKNVGLAAELAASYGMDLNLESYGDIVGRAAEAGAVFEALDLPNVHYNYDPGNTFRFARGKIDLAADLREAAILPVYLHMKDCVVKNGILENTAVGNGDTGFDRIFEVLESKTASIPAGLEVPQTFRIRLEDLSMQKLQSSEERAYEIVMQSIDFLKAHTELIY